MSIKTDEHDKLQVNTIIDLHTNLSNPFPLKALKNDFQIKKNSSVRTIFSISNTMVGSAIVIYPLIFNTSGIITSMIILFFVGAVSCKTCLLEIIHFNMSEMDFPDAVERILGRKWFWAESLCSVILLYLVGMIYFILICNMLYPFLKYVLGQAGVPIAPIDSIDFGQFSFQYTGLIMILVCFSLFCVKDMKTILKIGQCGIFSIIVFIFYIITRGFENLDNIGRNNVTLFTLDIANLCGVFALSFAIHNVIIPIVKNNQEEKKNQRDVILGYIMTGLIYAIIGIFGSLSIIGIDLGGRKANTVFDYFTPNAGTAIIEILLFFQLLSVEPIIWHVARSQFFRLIYKNGTPPNKYFMLSNVFYSISCLILQMLNVDPTMIMSLNGAVCGFLLIYIIPIKMHLKSIYNEPSLINTAPDTAKLANVNFEHEKKLIIDLITFHPSNLQIRQKLINRIRYTLYTFLMLVGLAFALIKIVNLVIS